MFGLSEELFVKLFGILWNFPPMLYSTSISELQWSTDGDNCRTSKCEIQKARDEYIVGD